MPRAGSAVGHFFWQFCSYHVQRAQLLASFTHRLLVLAAVSLGCVTAGALGYYIVSGERLVACFFKSYGWVHSFANTKQCAQQLLCSLALASTCGSQQRKLETLLIWKPGYLSTAASLTEPVKQQQQQQQQKLD
jgi:hypothetical protein